MHSMIKYFKRSVNEFLPFSMYFYQNFSLTDTSKIQKNWRKSFRSSRILKHCVGIHVTQHLHQFMLAFIYIIKQIKKV